MKKLNPPPYGALELYDEAVKALGDPLLQNKFTDNRANIEKSFGAFDAQTITKTWCNLPRSLRGNPDAIVAGTLTKGELVSLYVDGVIRSKTAARDIYDKIKLATHDECPYCGGIGDIGEDGELATADHYLPKSRFPVYSVMPLNLIPACFVCNNGMGSDFATTPDMQPIHPYLDEPRFFLEKWTSATVVEGEPVEVDFSVAPPAHWSSIDKQRVVQHFKLCKLRSRYRSRVNSEISPLISQRRSTLKTLSADGFRDHLRTVANEGALPLNGWKRTLFAALADSDWFCERDF